MFLQNLFVNIYLTDFWHRKLNFEKQMLVILASIFWQKLCFVGCSELCSKSVVMLFCTSAKVLKMHLSSGNFWLFRTLLQKCQKCGHAILYVCKSAQDALVIWQLLAVQNFALKVLKVWSCYFVRLQKCSRCTCRLATWHLQLPLDSSILFHFRQHLLCLTPQLHFFLDKTNKQASFPNSHTNPAQNYSI